jgi:hypothetical protein
MNRMAKTQNYQAKPKNRESLAIRYGIGISRKKESKEQMPRCRSFQSNILD